MTFAPRFSPDGKKIIMSFAKDGKSDIYTMDLENRIVDRITNHPSIDTSPSYSPNGKFIAFNSVYCLFSRHTNFIIICSYKCSRLY